MPTERADQAYFKWLEGAQRFDYFMVGISIALVGYWVPRLHLVPVGLNASTVEMGAAIVLLASTYCGLARLRAVNTTLSAMHSRLHGEEAAGELVAAVQSGGVYVNKSTGKVFTAEGGIKQASRHQENAVAARALQKAWGARAKRWYDWRDRLLLLGLGGMLVARILAAYSG